MTTQLPDKYQDPEYLEAHRLTFANPPRYAIPRILPPAVSEEDFEQVIADFVSVVGKHSVFVGDALADYIDPYDIHDADESKRKIPSVAVCPNSTDELKEVLAIANKYIVPLWTFSRGKNLGYGGPAPRVNGSVALDLHRMNKIIEVNDDFAYAVVEPGVTFADLYDYCVNHKLKVWPSTASLGWGSVMGNTLDRGMGFGANFAHHQAMAGIEVMLSSGQLLRTGQWGIVNSPSAFLSQYTYGPSLEGLFVQSNLGVVTKMSLWMTRQPTAYMSCAFSVPQWEELAPMVDALGALRRDGVINTCIWFSGLIEGLCISGRREDYWKGEGPIPDDVLEGLRKERGYMWLARWGLYGPSEKLVQATFAEIKVLLAAGAPMGRLEGTLFTGPDGKGLVDAATIPPAHGSMWAGVPSMRSLPLVNWTIPHNVQGKPAHGDYAPVIPNSGAALLDWMDTCKPLYESHGLELMADFFMHERTSVLMNMFSWNNNDAAQQKRMDSLYMALHGEAKKRGYGMYRAHVNHMDLIANLNDFNGHAYKTFVEQIKDTVDPNGILSPGKQGIWPNKFSHLREEGGERGETTT